MLLSLGLHVLQVAVSFVQLGNWPGLGQRDRGAWLPTHPLPPP